MRLVPLLVISFLLLLHGAARSQSADSAAAMASRPHSSAPEMRAAPLTGSVHLDGRLDEAAWQAATPVDRFTQRQPKEGEPSTERIEVRALIAEDALYIGARLYESEPAKIRSRLVRRDDVKSSSDSDYFVVQLDPYHDHLTGVLFRVGPSGSFDDATIAASGNQDTSWDPVWTARTSIDSLGWTVEMEIPLSQLHYNRSEDGVWGIQIRRWINRKQELSEFSFTPLKEEASVSKFGHLTGLERLGSPRHVELLPYGRVRTEFTQVPSANPFRDGADEFPAAGVDVKYGVTSNLTLNATVNPDFGEVEVDPAVVNLSAFETFYPERRPFFVEGADVFQFGETRTFNSFNSTIPFHARRIGRPPQHKLEGSNYQFVDSPARTTITTAAKLTGKTANGWTIGAIDAVTPVERASYVDTVGREMDAPVEPLTNYLVGRVRRDYRQGNTVVGGMITAVNRNLEDATLRDQLRSSAYAGGFDLNHYFWHRCWSLDAMILGSTVRGDRDVIAATQRSSARYFQRPDAKTLDYDPTRTSLTGYSGLLSLNKIAGKHGFGSLTYQDWSPGFEINDVGFQNAADCRALSALAMYKENKPGKLVRSWDAYTFANGSWNYDGDNTYVEYAGHVEGTLTNYWFGSLRGEYYPGSLDDRLTRGGPLSRIPGGMTFRATVNSDSRKIYTLGLTGVESWDEAGGHLAQLNATVSVRPTSALRLLFEPGLKDLHDNAQYVQTEVDPLATATYGSRYVFASLHQTQLSLDTRLDWTFSPKLSLQLYVQPLIVSGEYTRFKELRAPRTYEFDVYGGHRGTIQADSTGGYKVDPDAGGAAPSFHIDDPDFNFRSLRGNAVLRWEYRPGSALFFVWQQSREGEEPFGDFELSRDWHGLFRIEPENLIAVKATYWLPL